jgi:WD40 repeat protein
MPDCNHIILSSLNNQMQVINLIDEEEVLKYTGHTNSKYLVDIALMENNNRKYLISGSEDDNIALWDIEMANECVKIPAGTTGQNINCLSCNKGGILAYSGFPDPTNYLNLISLSINN